MELAGATAIVTGASRGLGVHIASRLADKGVNLSLAARSAEGLEQTAERLRSRGVRVVAIPTDVTQHADRQELVSKTIAEFGSCDLLVNNAGVEMVGYFETLEADRIEAAISTNLTSLILLTREVVPHMVQRGRGHICNIASAAGKVARPFGSAYAGTKHGVVGFSWSLRAELRDRGVEVTVVCPSYVSGTGMFADRRAGEPPKALAAVTPEEVARQTVDVAIGRNKAEVIVGPALVRTAKFFHAISPDVPISTGWRTGLYRFLQKEATGDED